MSLFYVYKYKDAETAQCGLEIVFKDLENKYFVKIELVWNLNTFIFINKVNSVSQVMSNNTRSH